MRPPDPDPWEDPDGEAYGDEDIDLAPDWFPGSHLPEHARRMGLTHHVPEGALLDFAGKLDPSRPFHRVTAWVLLVVFGLPVLFYVMRLLSALA
jgi:hypothetical protein